MFHFFKVYFCLLHYNEAAWIPLLRSLVGAALENMSVIVTYNYACKYQLLVYSDDKLQPCY